MKTLAKLYADGNLEIKGKLFEESKDTMLPVTHDLVWHLDANTNTYTDEAGTIPANIGDRVAYWKTNVGNVDALQSDINKQPLLIRLKDDLLALDFSRDDDFMSTRPSGRLYVSTPFQLSVAFRMPKTDTNGYILGPADNRGLIIQYRNGGDIEISWAGGGSVTHHIGIEKLGKWIVVTGIAKDDETIYRINGVEVGISSGMTRDWWGQYIGDRLNEDFPTDYLFGEFVGYGTELSTFETEAVESYLLNKWVNSTSLSFDGIGDTVDDVGVNNINWGEGTWEFWVRTRTDFANLPTSYYESFFGVEQYSPSFRLRVYARGGASFHFRFSGLDHGDLNITFPSSLLTLNEWCHVAITYDGNKGQANSYINGVHYSTTSFAAPSDDLGTPFTIGRVMGYSYLDSDLKEFRVWNKALNESEIQTNMDKSLTGDENGLVLYLPMGEGEGTIANDKTGNGNDGTINGATWIEELKEDDRLVRFDYLNGDLKVKNLTISTPTNGIVARIDAKGLRVADLIEDANI